METLLKRAHAILHERSEEKDRQYGDFTESVDKTAKIATLMGSKEITPDDVYNVLIAMKLARESHSHKEDNILDAVVYLAQKNIHAGVLKSISKANKQVLDFIPSAYVVHHNGTYWCNSHERLEQISMSEISEEDAWVKAYDKLQSEKPSPEDSITHRQNVWDVFPNAYVEKVLSDNKYYIYSERGLTSIELGKGSTIQLAWKNAYYEIEFRNGSSTDKTKY